MNCNCTNSADIFKLEDNPGFEIHIVKLATGNWVHLYQCLGCGQFWRVDEQDKYRPRFVVRIPSKEGWEQFDSTALEKKYLVQARGGVTDELCIWQRCSGNRVKGVTYCVDHLYKTGVRE